MSQSAKMKQGHKAVYGVGDCQPQALQCLANAKAFTANMAAIMFLKVCIFAYAIGMMRTLEKRFSLSSQHIGVLNSTNDIVEVIVVLSIGYFARKAHKPRVLSISLIILASGCFMYAIPYFVFGTKENIISQKSEEENSLVCDQSNVNDSSITCHKADTQLVETNSSAFVVFIWAAILIGLGGSGVQVMGISYIDENVKHENVALYLGFATACYPLGPVVEFLVAALATSLPENLKSSTLESTDPAFIGAWWLGYTVFPILLFTFSIPLFFFPKHFPEYYLQKTQSHAALKNKGITQSLESGRIHRPGGIGSMIWRELKEFPKSLMKMLSKPEYITNVLSHICGVYMILGLGLNMTRYLETYFLQPASTANVITALSGAVSGVFGTALAGIIVHRLKLQLKGKALMACITSLGSVVCIACLMLFTCDQVDLAGQRNDKGLLDIDLPCASECTCPRDMYLPVCGETSSTGDSQRMTFLSPCHAGCQSLNGTWTFSNCSCLATPMETTSRGPCSPPCTAVYMYAAVMFLLSFAMSLGRVPSTIVSLRVVDPELRAFALGFQSFSVNLLAFIPGPILIGTLIDSTCLVWSENCGETGNCLFYNTTKYRLLMHGVTLAFVSCSFIFAFLTWVFIRQNTKKGLYDEADTVASSVHIQNKENDLEFEENEQTPMNQQSRLESDNEVTN